MLMNCSGFKNINVVFFSEQLCKHHGPREDNEGV